MILKPIILRTLKAVESSLKKGLLSTKCWVGWTKARVMIQSVWCQTPLRGFRNNLRYCYNAVGRVLKRSGLLISCSPRKLNGMVVCQTQFGNPAPAPPYLHLAIGTLTAEVLPSRVRVNPALATMQINDAMRHTVTPAWR